MIDMKTKRHSTVSDVIAVIRKAKRVLISGHIRTDGDSLGSMIALARLLNQAGIDAVATGERKGLGGPGFLRGVELLVAPEKVVKKSFDLLITVDCAAADRVPEPIRPFLATLPVVCIDHHVTNSRFGTYNWVEKAASTGELIWKLARRAKWTLDQVSAEALWVAVITDSGRFAYDSTLPSTLRCGADLVKYGVRTSLINDKIYASFSSTNIELKRRAFRTLTILHDGEIASVSLTGRDFEETDGTKADAEDVIDIPRNLAGNRVALFFYGNEDDHAETRVSVRTREPLDATELVKKFGGGGHARAAGCTIYEPLTQAKRTMMKSVEQWLYDAPAS